MKLRGVLKRNDRLPRHLLSGLLVCEQCGGTFRRVNAREYGCASHVDGGDAACTNGIRFRGELAERMLLDQLTAEILSPEGIALLERKVREHVREYARPPKPAPKREGVQVTKGAPDTTPQMM